MDSAIQPSLYHWKDSRPLTTKNSNITFFSNKRERKQVKTWSPLSEAFFTQACAAGTTLEIITVFSALKNERAEFIIWAPRN